MSTQKKPASLRTIFSEAYHVITSNPRHFTILSLMFVFPLSISTLILNVLRIPTSPENPNSIFVTSHPLFVPALTLIMVLLSLCTAPSITYSAFQAYYDVPLMITTSLRAILHSFFPVLGTLIATQAIVCLVSLAYAVVMFVVYYLLVLLGLFNIESTSNLMAFFVPAIALLMIAFAYMGLNWCLSSSVVVIESKWGFAALKRSSYLVKGMKRKLLFVMCLFGTISFALSSLSVRVAANAGGRFTSWGFLLQMIVLAVLMTILSLYGVAVIVVVYVHCKELHGELELFEYSKNVRSGGGKYEQVYSGIEAV